MSKVLVMPQDFYLAFLFLLWKSDDPIVALWGHQWRFIQTQVIRAASPHKACPNPTSTEFGDKQCLHAPYQSKRGKGFFNFLYSSSERDKWYVISSLRPLEKASCSELDTCSQEWQLDLNPQEIEKAIKSGSRYKPLNFQVTKQSCSQD